MLVVVGMVLGLLLLAAWVGGLAVLLKRSVARFSGRAGVVTAGVAPVGVASGHGVLAGDDGPGEARLDPQVGAAWRAQVRASGVVLWVALAALVGCAVAGWFIDDFALTLFLAPAWAAAAAMLVAVALPLARTPAVAETDAVRQADLTYRGPATGGHRGGVLLGAWIAVALAGFALLAGLVSVVDDTTGRWQALEMQSSSLPEVTYVDGMPATSTGYIHQVLLSPFPGWSYSLPLLGLVLVALALGAGALRRNADRRRWQGEGAQEWDARGRGLAASIPSLSLAGLLSLALAGLVGWLGASLVQVSGALDPIGMDFGETEALAVLPGVDVAAYLAPGALLLALAVAVGLVGLGCLALAVAAWVKAARARPAGAQSGVRSSVGEAEADGARPGDWFADGGRAGAGA